MSFKLLQPAIPYNDSCLASKIKFLTSGNRQFLAMVTSGSQVFQGRQFLAMVTFGSIVGNHQFQPLGTGSSLQWKPMVPRLGSMSSNLWDRQLLAMVTSGSQVGNHDC